MTCLDAVGFYLDISEVVSCTLHPTGAKLSVASFALASVACQVMEGDFIVISTPCVRQILYATTTSPRTAAAYPIVVPNIRQKSGEQESEHALGCCTGGPEACCSRFYFERACFRCCANYAATTPSEVVAARPIIRPSIC